MATDAGTTDGRARTIATTAAVVAASQTVIFLLLPRLADRYDSVDVAIQVIWWPALIAVWSEAVLIGTLFLMAERTRPIGVGFLLGTIGTVALFSAWAVLVFSSGFA